jgi:coenzyme F420-reducing hydrogenase delta subunit
VDDYELPELDVVPSAQSKAHEQVRLIDIVMVRRGECSFVTKAKVASQKGAHAVIIVDKEDSALTSHDLQNIIVADDGFGQAVSIPSILISQYDGEPLIAAAKNEDVVVELAWDVPTDHVVAIDLWMNSAAADTQRFLQRFTESRKTLNEVMKFTPHYDVFSADPDLNGYSGLCYDSSAKYCAADPDGAGPVSGKDVLEENVRQLCIHEMTRVPRSRQSGTDSHGPVVFYAEKWWNYVEQLPRRCPVDSANEAQRFGRLCSEKLMQEIGIDVQRVQHCVQTTTESKLEHELVNKAWSPRALRVNGWRYKGMLDADLVTRAVCSGFVSQPGECNDLLKPHKPSNKFLGIGSTSGVSMGSLMTAAVALILFTLCSLGLYRRCLEKNIRTQVRESVMLEVNDQMMQYTQVGDAI